jgi:hypothetical protein
LDLIYVLLKKLTLNICILLNLASIASGQGNLVYPEKTFIHTDRNIYVAGEYILHTMYLKGDPDRMSRFAYILLCNSQSRAVSYARLDIKDRISFGSLFIPDTLRSGYYEIVCFTNLMRNDPGSYFRKQIIVINRFDEKLEAFNAELMGAEDSIVRKHDNLSLIVSKNEYRPREKINFSFGIDPGAGDEISIISVSVGQVLPEIPSSRSVSDYFKTTAEKPYTELKFKPETGGAVLHGRIIHNNPFETATPEKLTIYVSTPDTIPNLQYAETDSTGSFSVVLNQWYDGREVFIRTKEKVNATLELDDRITGIQPVSYHSIVVPGLKDYLFRRLKVFQAQRFYNKSPGFDTVIKVQAPVAPPRVWYKEYSTVYPSDYIELRDFNEISREILPALKVRKNKEGFVASYSYLQSQSDRNDEPAIFLDGVPIDDINQVIRLGTPDINRVEIIPVTRIYGGLSFNGILGIFSNNHEINNVQFKTPATRYLVISSNPWTKPPVFQPSEIRQLPDLRMVLLWEPALAPGDGEDISMECYASDLKGEFMISIQGLTKKGIPLNGSARFSVK